MESKAQKSYLLLKKNVLIDEFRRTEPSKTCFNKSLSTYARWFGTELEKCIASLIFILNKDNSYFKGEIRANSFPYIINKNHFELKVFLTRNLTDRDHNTITEFINNYKLPYKNCYGITDSLIQTQFTNEIKRNLLEINFNKFISKKLFIPRLALYQELASKSRGGGYIDMIIDNKIIDIKTIDIKSLIPKEYFSQLLYYYFWLKAAMEINFSNKSFTELSRINIDTIALYFSKTDQLYEYKISELVKNENLIQDCFNHEIEYGNSKIRNIIDLSLCKKNSGTLIHFIKKNKVERFQILSEHILDLTIQRKYDLAKITLETLSDEGFDDDILFLRGILSFMENNMLWAGIYFGYGWKKSIKLLKDHKKYISNKVISLKIQIEEATKIAHPFNVKHFSALLIRYNELLTYLTSLESLNIFLEYNLSASVFDKNPKRKQ